MWLTKKLDSIVIIETVKAEILKLANKYERLSELFKFSIY